MSGMTLCAFSATLCSRLPNTDHFVVLGGHSSSSMRHPTFCFFSSTSDFQLALSFSGFGILTSAGGAKLK